MSPCLGAHQSWPGLLAGTDLAKRRGLKATSVRGAVQRILGCAVIHITPHMRAWVTVQPMDFRDRIDGLAASCGKRLAADPSAARWSLSAFSNRARMAINVLVYEGRGF